MIRDQRLHQSKLKTFKRYAVSQGYKIEATPLTARFEVLRLRLPDPAGTNPPLLFFRQNGTNHITAAQGEASDLVRRWLEKRRPREESMADLAIEADLNRAMGISNDAWVEAMFP